MAGLVSLFGLLKFGEYFTSTDSSFESLLVPALDKLGDIPEWHVNSYTSIKSVYTPEYVH